MLSSLCVILYESIFILSTLINVYCNLLFSGREGGVFSGFQYCCLQWQEVVFWHFEVELKGFLKRKTKKKNPSEISEGKQSGPRALWKGW